VTFQYFADHRKPEIARQVKELRRQGLSWKEIQRRYNNCSRATLYRVVKEQVSRETVKQSGD
jgi:DNA invertase Pin-like site-specific DNA recombinase